MRCCSFRTEGGNPYIRAVKAQELEIDRCVEAFNDISAPGNGAASPIFRAFRSHVNNGIALNYWMAETYVFDVLKKPYALFLEDDLLLSSNYLSVTSDLIGMALKNKRIGYVSAYGNFWASLEDQNRNQESLMRMHESWGFATTYNSWKAQIAIRNAYLTLVSGCDYRFRNQQAIMTLYEKLGYKCHYTTQDSARWVACHAAGMVRLTPYTCHARYIGAVGEHCTGLHYKKYGFDRAAFFPVKPALRAPSEEEIDDWYRADTENFKNGYEHYYVSQAGANV